MILTIEARQLQVGDQIHLERSMLKVETIEYGQTCNGVHVNVVRREARVMRNKKGKIIGLNPDRGAMVFNAGCYVKCASLTVSRND